ncbi:peptidoglycan-binding protein [Nocardioides sp.]|uniref:L,D-transpeptidase family protein n=1 Tax=Nocardioides sp. TaxID=35761 RepID=UPI003528D738
MRALRATALVLLALTVAALGVAGGLALRKADQGSLWAVDAGPHGGATSTPSAEPSVEPSTTPTPSASPSPTTPPESAYVLEPGDSGLRVRALQQRLFQLAWLPETVTGRYDDATRAAVAGFQGKRGFKRTGRVDQRTWRRLVAMTDTPTHDQMFNVLRPGPALLAAGDSGDGVRDAQARLKQIAWLYGAVTGSYDDATVTAVRGFQAKRGIPVTGEIDQRTLDRLTAMTTTPTYEEKNNIEPEPGALDARCRTGRVLCIDKTSRTLRWVVDGKVLQTLDARFGSTVNDTPTREGVFHVYLKDADHVSKLYGSSMPYSMFFSGGQAVHYSSDFASVGYYGASHGCVNIRDYGGIQWLFSQVRVGDTVVVYWS